MKPLRAHAIIILTAAAGFAALVLWMRASERAFLQRATAAAAMETPPRPLAHITSALAAAKLVTVEIDTFVKLERGDTSWRGDVAARVEVPVRIAYGTDLTKMKADAVGYSGLSGSLGYVIRIPRPTRISTEIFSENEKSEVQTGWMRLRSQAGEYYLSQARKDTAAAARGLALRDDDAQRVEAVTREQVERLVKSIVGEKTPVRVVYEDRP